MKEEKLLQLGYSELEIGNLPEAERYFKRLIEDMESSAAWIGLGKTRLLHLQKHYEENPNNNANLISNAFYCFTQAKKSSPENEEAIEVLALDLSSECLVNFYSILKQQAEEYKKNRNAQTASLIIALLSSRNPQQHDALRREALEDLQGGKNLESSFKAGIETANALRNTAIPFAEQAIHHRNTFIQTIADQEHELHWHIMDEKEKRKMQKRWAVATSSLPNNKHATQSNWDKPEWQGGVIVWMILIGYLIYKIYIE